MRKEHLFAVMGVFGILALTVSGFVAANAGQRVDVSEANRLEATRALARATGAEFNPAVHFNRPIELYRFGSALQGKGPNQLRLYRIDVRVRLDGYDSVVPVYVPRESVVVDRSVEADRVIFHRREIAGQIFLTVRMNPTTVRPDDRPILLR